MNLNSLKTIGGPRVQRVIYRISKYAPEILTGVGIAGVIGGTVLIARATTHLEEEVAKFESEKLTADHRHEAGELDDKEYQKALAGIYVRFVMTLTKLYGSGVSLEIASIASILAAHGIMRSRNAALLGAYKAVESAFTAYRARLIEEFGEEKDYEYRNGIRTERIEDPETGKKVTRKIQDPNHYSQYARFFDEGNPNWEEFPQYNFLFVKNQQNWANDRLHARGFLFLNEVYEQLGIAQTQAGQIVGWVVGKEGGDHYVDFGVFNGDEPKKRAFVNGEELSVLLDFNVDGVILDLI